MGYDNHHYLYSIYDVYSNNQSRIQNVNGIVWAAEIQQSKRDFQTNLKPYLLFGISYNDVARWIDQKINIFRSTVQNIADNAANAVRRTLDVVINGVKHTANSAWNKAVEAVNSITSKVSAGISDAKRYADSIVRSVTSTANSAWNKANEVANSIGYKISSAISTAKGYADIIVSSARSVANSALSKANDAINSVSSKVNSAINTAKGYADIIVSSARSVANSALSKANDAINSVSSKVNSAINTAKGYAESIVNSAKSTLNSAIAAAKDSASNAYNKALEVANSVGGKISSAINTAKGYADGILKSAKDTLNKTIDSVKTIASDAYSMAQNLGVSFELFKRNFTLDFYDKIRIFENKVKPFTDFIKNINETVKNIVDPLLEPFKKVVDSINATVKSLIDAAVKPFNDFISGFKAKTKEILDTALQNAKDYFKGILDNFRSGIETIKATIDTIVRNINELLAFRKETNSRLSSLEGRLNAVANTYVTKVEFTNFKTDVDKRIKLLNNAVSSINTDINAAFQQFNLTLIDGFNRVVAALNKVDNMEAWRSVAALGNAMKSVNSMLDKALSAIYLRQAEVINAIKDINSESWLNKIGKFIENATLLSKLDNIKSSIDNLSKKDIFDNAIFKGLEKFFAANKLNEISDNLNNLLDKFTQYIDAFNATAQNIFMLYSYDIIFEGYFDKITFKLDKLLSKFDDLIQIVKEIKIPKEENNTTINKEAETNFWDVLKEAVKTLAEFIKNPAKILELLFSFIRSLIVPDSLDGLNNLKTNFDSNINRKFSFVGQFKHNFVDIYNTPRTFDDITINGSGLFSGSFTIPLSLINIFAPYVKALANGFLVLAFLQSCYVWYHKKFKLESSD